MGLFGSLFEDDSKKKKNNKKNKKDNFLRSIAGDEYLLENNGNLYMALDDMDEDEDEDYD